MRAFIAIEVPEEIHVALRERQAALRAAAPLSEADVWPKLPENIHLTLKFLGEISERQAAQVTEALEAFAPFGKFPIEVKGFGFFPNAHRPRVFWVGVQAPPDLEQLAARVEGAMEKLGFAREERAFTPHLTLARFRSPRPQPALASWIEQHGQLALGRFEVAEFFLFSSKLLPQGAQHQKIARFPRPERA